MSPKALLQHIATLQQTVIRTVAALHEPDPETLHELRVSLRRLRTLLRPLARHKSCQPLYEAVSALFNLSNPLRDLEVLLTDLETHGETKAAARRRHTLHKSLQALAFSAELKTLQEVWAQWDATVTAKSLPGRRRLKKRFQQAIALQQKRLSRNLQEENADLHELRIHIKRLRYFLEARDADRKTRSVLLEHLCAAQNALGQWHDLTCHLACAETETDLAASCARWQLELATAQAQLPPLLKAVRKARATR